MRHEKWWSPYWLKEADCRTLTEKSLVIGRDLGDFILFHLVFNKEFCRMCKTWVWWRQNKISINLNCLDYNTSMAFPILFTFTFPKPFVHTSRRQKPKLLLGAHSAIYRTNLKVYVYQPLVMFRKPHTGGYNTWLRHTPLTKRFLALPSSIQ